MEIPGSPWRGSLGGPPVTGRRADRQPSVAITVQIQCSYFSGTTLSFFFFLTFGRCFFSQPRENPHRSPGPAHGVPRCLLIRQWSSGVGFWQVGGHRASRLLSASPPSGSSAGSVQVEPSAPRLQKHSVFPVHFHLEASVWLKSHFPLKAQSSKHGGSDPRVIWHRPLSISGAAE